VLDLIPVLDLSAGAVLNSVIGGQTTNERTFASMMNANHIVGDNLGVAITAAKGSGTWEYRTPGGAWTAIGKVSGGKALFLDADTEVRFTASAAALPGTATLSFKAWDKTKIAVGSVGAASGSIVSKQTEILNVSIGNQAPQLIVGGVTLPSVSASSPKPSSGVTVKTILGTSFVDLDPKSVKGLAITAADNANGKWQYSIGGNVWFDVGVVSKDSAILLRDTAKIRFVPNAGFTGTATFSFVAWDRTTGQSGDRGIDTDSGINAFSASADTATITVTP
jgi:hypothetical protein